MAQLAQVPKGGTAGGRNSGEARVCGCRRCKRLIPVISQAKGQNELYGQPGNRSSWGGWETVFLWETGRRSGVSSVLFPVCK